MYTEALALYRLLFPRSRAQGRFKFDLNTGCRKSVCCVFCLASGPTWSPKWSKTSRAKRWEAEHACNPMLGVLEQACAAYAI